MTLLLVAFLAAVGSAAEPESPPSILTVGPPFTDLGAVAPGASVSWTLGLTHTQGPAVAVEGAEILGDAGFAFDGVIPSLPEGGSAALGFTFASSVPGEHTATVEVTSDAACTEPVPVVVRAWVSAPCLAFWPPVLDFGPVAPGGSADLLVHVAPCAGTPVSVDGLLADGTLTVTSADLPLVVGAAGGLLRLTATATDAAASVAQLDLTVGGNVVASLTARANDCPNGDPARWDADGDGLSDCGADPAAGWVDADGDGHAAFGGDCDEASELVGPEVEEAANGADDDCDGLVDEHLDADGDGAPVPVDCDDTSPWSRPGGDEVVDGEDNDCDGSVDESGRPTDTCPPWDQEPAEATNPCSCGGSGSGAGWWLVLALVAAGRRR